ncbi:AMP-binding protein [Actinomadura graeca]|uniref:AMP-binding protein n=1 Tax=Actinomadura graeca TaxID=2750812 RepID=A0ABX8QQP7_9ACTN|nr:AMP-binding protein [Actinomadura graeca]QXJ21077.1 AMP-binding protein [Actinomadura graeca]
MEGNLAAELADRAYARRWLDRPLYYSDDAVFSHGEVHDAGARAAGVLQAAGVHAGDRVLIALPDSIGFVAAFLGTLRLGAVAVLAGPEQSRAEHASMVADAAPVAAVCTTGLAARFTSACVLTEDDLAAGAGATPEPVLVPSDASAYVQYTSGTTGRPKGAVHRHSDAHAYFQAMAVGALGITSGDITFSLSKACYPLGLGATVLFPMLSGGAAVLWPDAPSVRGAVRQARRRRPTLLFTCPTWYARLVGEPHRNAVRTAFGSLRAAASAGEPLLPTLADRIEDVLGCPVLDGLGSTEVGHTFISNTVDRRRRGVLGVVLDPYEIEVRAENGPTCPAEPGALYVRGPSVMKKYLGRPDETAEVLSPDGWLRTGDLVRVDAEGFVHHHGRILDRVTVAGEEVLPLEVERVLGRHPAVVEVAVIAVGGPVPGRGLRAFAVVEGESPAADALERELLDLARAELPPHKVPDSVTFLDELPRTSTGKIRRGVLAVPSSRPAPSTRPASRRPG